ncbi:colipase-like protein 2 [Pteropus medius]|uniref:colipase-like protein 2 n=1 Tax=Pteropus vampyrus TaxID=132908 RepID=UPI00196A7239|nr:colipase-like protein 2 [Pteropus giganteus]
MATAFALIAGVLLPGWGEFSQFKKAHTLHRTWISLICYAFCLPLQGQDCSTFIFEPPTPQLSAHNQRSHQHHMPLPNGLALQIQGRDLSPPVLFVLEEDAGLSLPSSSPSWSQRPWDPPSG